MEKEIDQLDGMYRVPNFNDNDVVLDIGMNYGYFTILACRKGAGRVIGYEPSEKSFEIASKNLWEYKDDVDIFHKAVWRSDKKEITKYNKNDDGSLRLSFIKEETKNIEIENVGLDEILKNLKTVRFMKMDVEGSEYPILLTSKLLFDKVEEMSIEVHKYSIPVGHTGEKYDEKLKLEFGDNMSPDGLFDYLINLGYKGEHIKTGDVGLSFIYLKK